MSVLTCEKCNTQFEVPDEALAGGRKVRCTNCYYVWTEPDPSVEKIKSAIDEPPADSFADMLDDDPEPVEPVPDSVKPADTTGAKVTITEDEATKKRSTKAALALFAGLVLMALIGLLLFQKSIVSAFPGTAGLYKSIGIDAKPAWEGLRIQEGIAIFRQTPQGEMLYIETSIINISNEDKRIPPVRIDLTDSETGDVLQSWNPEMVRVVLAPGQKHDMKLGFTDARHKFGKIKVYFRPFD